MTATKTELLETSRERWKAAWLEAIADRSTGDQSERASRLRVYDGVSRQLPPDDDLADLAAWAFNQSVDRLATQEGAPKSIRVLIANVTLDLFDEMMRSNLRHPSWAEEELDWRNTPSRLNDVN